MAEIDAEELERRIERSRADLARTVDAIADRVSPKRVAQRGVAKVRWEAEQLLTTVASTVGEALDGRPKPYPGELTTGEQDAWAAEERARELAPVLIGVGAVLVVSAAIMLWRRRR